MDLGWEWRDLNLTDSNQHLANPSLEFCFSAILFLVLFRRGKYGLTGRPLTRSWNVKRQHVLWRDCLFVSGTGILWLRCRSLIWWQCQVQVFSPPPPSHPSYFFLSRLEKKKICKIGLVMSFISLNETGKHSGQYKSMNRSAAPWGREQAVGNKRDFGTLSLF